MSHFRYTAAHKIDAVRRVVEDGHSVCDVAREIGVGEGSLFFWVRRYRDLLQGARAKWPAAPGSAQEQTGAARDVGTLVAYLRRASAR